MYVYYEDDGSFKAAHILSEADATLQVESDSGKRSKIKRSAVLFSFDAPAPAELMPAATALAESLVAHLLALEGAGAVAQLEQVERSLNARGAYVP